MANESAMQTLGLDPPVQLVATYRMDLADRQYLDQQIRFTQKALHETALVGYDAHWSWVDPAAETVQPGDALCVSSTGDHETAYLRRATTSALSDAGTVLGVAVTEAGPGGRVLVATSGHLPRKITGLAVIGYVTYVRVTAAGRLEQTTTPTGETIVGRAEPNGRMTIALGSEALGGSLAVTNDWKESARFAITSALPAYTRTGNTIEADANGAIPNQDGVPPAVNDRALLAVGTSVDNGIWVFTALGSGGSKWAMARASDADTSGDVTVGLRLGVTAGTNNKGVWQLITADPITLNSTPLTFQKDQGLAPGITAGQVAVWDGSTWTAGPLDLADSDARTGLLPVANGGTGLSALGTAYKELRVNAGATALEYTDVPVVFAPVMDWATFIALVNAQAALGRAVQMGPGTWTCDAAVALDPNAHIIGGPTVVINSTITLTAPFAEFVFYRFVATGAVAATLSSNAVIGAKTLSASASVAPGTRIWVGQTAGTGHTYLASQYWVQSVSGSGPYTLTLDRAILFPFATGDEIKPITSAPDNIQINGRGMTITGRGDRAIEFTGGWKVRVSGVNYEYDGSTNFGAFCSLDIGCLDCSVRDCTVEMPPGVSSHGVLQESCEHCDVSGVRVTGGSVGFIGYDSADCEFNACSSSAASQAGMLLTSNLMTVGCRAVRVNGGTFSNSTAGHGILIGYATDCVLNAPRATGNLYGVDSGTTAVRLRGVGVITSGNTNRGILSQAPGSVWVSPVITGEASSIGVRDSCDIITPRVDDFSSYGIYVEGAAVATTRVNVHGGRLASGQSGTECCYIAAGASFRIAGVHFEMASGAANQTAVHHITGAGPVSIDQCTASQSSASSGYVGGSGNTVYYDAVTTAGFSALTTPWNVHASGTAVPTQSGNVTATLTTADVTLTHAQAVAQQVTTSGALTGNRALVFPKIIGTQWAIYNGNSGAYTLTAKTSTGSGVVVPQGYWMPVACDGSDVVAIGVAVSPTAVMVTQQPTVQWASTIAAPTLKQVTRDSDAATQNLTLGPQAPYASATGANRAPGSLVVALAAPTNSGTTEAGLQVTRGGQVYAQIGPGLTSASQATLWLHPATAPSSANYTLLDDGSTLIVNAIGSVALYTSSGTPQMLLSSALLQWYQSVSSPETIHGPRSSDLAVSNWTLRAQSAYTSASTNKDGGHLLLQGGAEKGAAAGKKGGVRVQLNGTTETMLEATEVAIGRRVVALCRGTDITTTQMPSGTGDGVVYLANATTARSTGTPVGGGILEAGSGDLFWTDEAGITSQLN